MKRISGFILLAFMIGGCAAYQLDSAQTNLRTSFASGDYSSTAELIQNLSQEGVYKSKDRVLLNLESGMTNHFAGNYQQSIQSFNEAENQIDELYTKSVTRAIQSFVVNDNSLAYDGEDYEDIYLNVFKSLNFIHQNELESALVEVRRVSYKLTRLGEKYHGLVEELSKADTTSTDPDKWKTGETNVQNSALGRYLSAILYAKTNKPDDARIEYENLLKAYQEQPSVYAFDNPSAEELKKITDPDAYNVLVKCFTGRGPTKTQNDLRIYLDESDTYLKFSLPTLQMYNSQVRSVNVKVNGEQVPLHLIEEMDLVAKEVYKVKEPIIYARTVVRTFLKAAAADKLKDEAAEEDETLGKFVNLMGKIAQETTEKADLRSWQTMPGKAHATVLKLPPGEHELEVQYFNSAGKLIYTDNQILNVEPDNPLNLLESIYWN